MTDHTLRARLAYIAAHGDSWAQAVARGDHDAACVPPVPHAEKAADGEDAPVNVPRCAVTPDADLREIACRLVDHEQARVDP